MNTLLIYSLYHTPDPTLYAYERFDRPRAVSNKQKIVF